MTAYLIEGALLFCGAGFGSLGLAWAIVEIYWRVKYGRE